MERFINGVKNALKWYMLILSFWMVILGGQAIAFTFFNNGNPGNGIFDCGNGVYISGEAITINTTPDITTIEIMESFEECLNWHILESEVRDFE